MPRIRVASRYRFQRQKSKKASCCCFAVRMRISDPLFLLMSAMVATAFMGIVLLGRGDRILYFQDIASVMSSLESIRGGYDEITSPTAQSAVGKAVSEATKQEVVVVAYAVTITHCKSELHSLQLLDSAAVVKHSIDLATSRRSALQQQNYAYQMYAFLHVEARNECAAMASVLERQLGYTVQWHSTPFDLEEVARKNPLLGEKIHKQGCCQEKELLKLYTLALTDHKIAVHLDLDTILLRPLDHLFNVMLRTPNENYNNDDELVYRHMQQHHGDNSRLPNNIVCFFTRDYNMANPGIQPLRVGMQGGFWVVRPDPQVLKDIVSLIVDHGDHYNKDCGWGSCELGSARFYGGAGFQGIISYFYTHVQPQRVKFLAGLHSQSHGPKFVELDRCLYNTMVDPPRSGCRTGEDIVACHSCQETNFEDLYGAHFTLCQKPYNCPPLTDTTPLCYRLHHAWHAIRANFEEQRQATEKKNVSSPSVAHTSSPPSFLELGDLTQSLERNAKSRLSKRLVQKFSSHCPRVGKKAYQFMSFA